MCSVIFYDLNEDYAITRTDKRLMQTARSAPTLLTCGLKAREIRCHDSDNALIENRLLQLCVASVHKDVVHPLHQPVAFVYVILFFIATRLIRGIAVVAIADHQRLHVAGQTSTERTADSGLSLRKFARWPTEPDRREVAPREQVCRRCEYCFEAFSCESSICRLLQSRVSLSSVPALVSVREDYTARSQADSLTF